MLVVMSRQRVLPGDGSTNASERASPFSHHGWVYLGCQVQSRSRAERFTEEYDPLRRYPLRERQEGPRYVYIVITILLARFQPFLTVIVQAVTRILVT